MDHTGIAKEFFKNHPGASLADLYLLVCQEFQTAPLPRVLDMLEDNTTGGLREIDLSSLDLAPTDCAALLEMSRVLPNLHSLNLSNTGMRNDTVPRLVDVVSENSSLTSLSIAHNPALGFAAAKLLLPLVKDHKRIIELDVQGTSMAPPTKELIRKVLLANLHPMEGSGPKPQSPPKPATPAAPQDAAAAAGEAAAPSPSTTSAAETAVAAAEAAAVAPPATSPTSPMVYADEDRTAEAVVHELVPMSKADAPEPTDANMEAIKARNHTVKSSLLDHEDRIRLFHLEMLAKCDSRKKEVRRRQALGAQMMEAFQKHWKWPLPSDFDVAACINDFQLYLSEDDLQGFYKYYSPSARQGFSDVRGPLEEMLDRSVSRKDRNALIEELRGRVLQHGPAMGPLVSIIAGFCDMMGFEGARLDALKAMVEEIDFKLAQAKVKLERIETQRERALEAENLLDAERFFMAGIDLQEEMVDLMLDRLQQLLDKGAHNTLLGKLRKLCEGADDQMNEAKRINDELLAKIERDLNRIQQKVQEEQEGMRYREEEFAEVQQRIEEELNMNTLQQDKVWRDIVYAHRALEDLAEQRFKGMENWMKEVEKHERRKVDYNAVLRACETHSVTLVELMHDCNNCDQILRHMDEFIRAATKSIAGKIDEAHGGIEKQTLQDQEMFLQVFRKYYLQLGEAVFQNQKRLEEALRQTRACELQISLCKETLDPALHQYRDQLQQLQERQAELTDVLNALQERADDRGAQFLPHEDALRAAGLEFESPLLQMREQILDRRARVLAMREAFLQENQEEYVEKEEEDIRALVHHTLEARKGGPASLLVPPLSPSRASLLDGNTMESLASAPDLTLPVRKQSRAGSISSAAAAAS